MPNPINLIRRSKASLTKLLKVAQTTKAYVREKLRLPGASAPRFTVGTDASVNYADTISPMSSPIRPPTPYPGGPVLRNPIVNYTVGSSIADMSTNVSTMDHPVLRRTTRRITIGGSSAPAGSSSSPLATTSQHVGGTGSSSAAATTRRVVIIGSSTTATPSALSPLISSSLPLPNPAMSPRSLRLARRDVNRMWRMRMAQARNRASFPARYAFRPAQEYYLKPARCNEQAGSQALTHDIGTQTYPTIHDQGTQTSPQVHEETAKSTPSALSPRHLPSGGSSADTPCGSPVWGAPLPRKRAREFVKGCWRLEDPFVMSPPHWRALGPVMEQPSIPQQAPLTQAVSAPQEVQVNQITNSRSAVAPPAPRPVSSSHDARRWSDFDSDEMSSTGSKRLVRMASNGWVIQHGEVSAEAPAQGTSSGEPAPPADDTRHCMDTSSRAWSEGSSDEHVNTEHQPIVSIDSQQSKLRPQDSVSYQEYVQTPEQHAHGQPLGARTPAAEQYDPLAPYGPVYITPGQVLLTGEYRGEWDSQPQNRRDPFDLHFGGDPRLDAVYAAAEQYDSLYRENRALMHNNNVSTWKVTVLEGELLRRTRQAQEQEAEILFLRSRLEEFERESSVVHNELSSVVESEETSDMYGP
ncbi:hypothetical protein EDD36DRAFT_419877 [Exophiala viscosa]|uniref:Uncharacterized protein n=1 Tax=Exophiala viscosa TaxID=2486360 RepID=A0AAN6DV88_9EURO|nr:hypothetical protein EDD36DRAFT_419877 [Exophiala viscosa]